MSGSYDELTLHLPTYLTLPARDALKRAIERHPSASSGPIATVQLFADDLLQGDLVGSAVFFDFLEERTHKSFALLVSNSCDMSQDNRRPTARHVQYCPVLKWARFLELVQSANCFDNEDALNEYLQNVRAQYVTSYFYITRQGEPDGYVAALDQIQSAPSSVLTGQRHWSLTQFGHYMLLFKLSYHFSRMRENLERRY